MRLVLGCLLAVGSALATAQPAMAPSVAPNREFERILAKLASTTSSGWYRQIDEAANAAPHLIDQLNGLAASGKLTEIVVLTSSAASNASKPGPFNAWTTGTSIIFTETLLAQLTKNREYDVVYPDDILPNNTTFVLGHLAFHLNAEKVSPRHLTMNDYVAAMLDQEARADIQAWNDALDAAVQQNNDQALMPRQIVRSHAQHALSLRALDCVETADGSNLPGTEWRHRGKRFKRKRNRYRFEKHRRRGHPIVTPCCR